MDVFSASQENISIPSIIPAFMQRERINPFHESIRLTGWLDQVPSQMQTAAATVVVHNPALPRAVWVMF